MIRPREEPDRDEFLAEINRKLAADPRQHNLTPDPEMGGLSPEQVARLIYLKDLKKDLKGQGSKGSGLNSQH